MLNQSAKDTDSQCDNSSTADEGSPALKRKMLKLAEEPSLVVEDNSLNSCRSEQWLQTFYTWTPSALSLHFRKCSEALSSPAFSHDGISWRIALYPRGYDNDSRDFFSLFLELLGPCDRPIHAKFAFYIRNIRGEYAHRQSSIHRFSSEHCFAGFSRYLKRNDMADGFNGILCHVRVERATLEAGSNKALGPVDRSSRNSSPVPRSSMSEPVLEPRVKLAADLDMLLYNAAFSDVVLVTPGREFCAHKAILAARSPVFFAMFEHQAGEKCQNRVKITDVHDNVFRELLRFIYTGRIANTENITCELMITAERYAIDDLKLQCEQKLEKRLTVENVANFYILADMHNAKKLKLGAIKFINEHATEVIRTGGYRLLVDSHLYLVEELYRHEHLGQ